MLSLLLPSFRVAFGPALRLDRFIVKNYRLTFISQGQPFHSVEHECHDDLEALALARQFADDFDVEIWEEGRLIGRLSGAK
jgi:hypothetical protein